MSHVTLETTYVLAKVTQALESIKTEREEHKTRLVRNFKSTWDEKVMIFLGLNKKPVTNEDKFYILEGRINNDYWWCDHLYWNDEKDFRKLLNACLLKDHEGNIPKTVNLSIELTSSLWGYHE